MIKRIWACIILVCFVFNMGLPSSFAQSSSGDHVNAARAVKENELANIESQMANAAMVAEGQPVRLKDQTMKAKLPIVTASVAVKRVGGINFDAALFNIQIKRDGNGIPLPVDQQPISHINVRGFRGIIMSITPANLPVMLGFAPKPQQLAMSN